MALLTLVVVILLVAAVRYAADSRDARDWSTPRPLAHPVPSTHHFGATPTPRSDAVRLARFVGGLARGAAHRRRPATAAAVVTPRSETVAGCC